MPKKATAITTPPAPLRLRIERARLTFGDFEDVQNLQEEIKARAGGMPPLSKMKELLARFIIGEDGAYLSGEAALNAVRAIPFDEIGGAFQQLAQGIDQVSVPPVNSNG